jgi:hypothetical protein
MDNGDSDGLCLKGSAVWRREEDGRVRSITGLGMFLSAASIMKRAGDVILNPFRKGT